jgi:MYXO-CTERM domain-containing protein
VRFRLALATMTVLLPVLALAGPPGDPVAIDQALGDGTPLVAGGTTAEGPEVVLNASSPSSSCNSGPYVMEIELRPAGSAFTFAPTHTGWPMNKSGCVQQPFPRLRIPQAALVPGTSYKWQVRERNGLGQTSNWQTFNSGGTAFIVGPVPSQRLAFLTAPRTFSAGVCSGAITVQTQDGLGNPSNVSQATSVSLISPSSTTSVYSDASCSTAISSLTIPVGSNLATFYIRETTSSALPLVADAVGTLAGEQTETVNPASATALRFNTAAQNVTVGTCAAQTQGRAADTFGNAVALGANTTVTLVSSSGTMVFYSDSGCTSATSSAVIAAGTSTVTFYWKDTTTGSPTITLSASGLSSATQTETVGPSASGPAVKIVFLTAPQTIVAGNCSAVAVVQSRDSFDNPAAVVGDASGQLTSTSSSLRFFTNSSCTLQTTTLTIPNGASTTTFYFRDTAAGTPTITATPSGLGTALQSANIQPGPASHLAFGNSPFSIAAGTCSGSPTVRVQDNFGNLTNVASNTAVMLSTTSAGGTFHLVPGCNDTAASLTIAAGTAGSSFAYRDTRAGSPTLSASASGLASGTQQESITPGPAVALTFATASRIFTAGVCGGTAGKITVAAVDAFGAATTTVGEGKRFMPRSTSIAGRFFADDTCTLPVDSGGGFLMAPGTGAVPIYYRDTVPGTPLVSLINDGGLSNPLAQQHQVVAPVSDGGSDGGAPTDTDAGTVDPDGGTLDTDGGSEPPGLRTLQVGCGCSAAPVSAAWALVLLAAARRRSRRRS